MAISHLGAVGKSEEMGFETNFTARKGLVAAEEKWTVLLNLLLTNVNGKFGTCICREDAINSWRYQ